MNFLNVPIKHRLLLGLIAIISVFFVFPGYSYGAISAAPITAENCTKGINTVSFGTACYWDAAYTTSGVALFYGPSKLGSTQNSMSDGYDKSYVAFAGLYKMRMYACPSQTAGNCTIAESTEYFDSLKSVQLNSSQLIVNQNPNFGGASGMLSVPSRVCYVFVSPDGSEWKTSAMRTCQDALALPEVPAFCYLNMGKDLNVDMGTMERGTISTVPGSTTKKNVPMKVMCSGDASLNATFTLQYTPITIVGSEVIGSSIDGVGVAVSINDKMMSPTDSVNMDFIAGVTEVTLGFEVVRDPYKNIGNIATGNFSADAVLVMTKQ